MNPSRMSLWWVQWFCCGLGIWYVVTKSSNWLQSPTHCQRQTEESRKRTGWEGWWWWQWCGSCYTAINFSSINSSPTMWLPVFYICFDLINLYKFGNQNYIFIINTNNATSFSIIFCPTLIIYNYNDRSRLDDKFL